MPHFIKLSIVYNKMQGVAFSIQPFVSFVPQPIVDSMNDQHI